MLRWIGRVVDANLSRGQGLDESGDPYGPPCTAEETERLLHEVRLAHSSFHASLSPPRAGKRWTILVPAYGGIDREGRPGLYGIHAAALRREGFGVAILTPPHHGARSEPGQESGWGFVRADLGHTSRAIAQTAAEVASLARGLREEHGAERVAGWGLSLGGASVGLAAAMGASFDALAFVAAVDSAASFYATGQNREARRRTLLKHGVGAAETEAAFRPFAPSSYPPPKGPRLHVVPGDDGIVPVSTQHAWRERWGGELMPLPHHGHGTAIADPLVARRVARWLATVSRG